MLSRRQDEKKTMKMCDSEPATLRLILLNKILLEFLTLM